MNVILTWINNTVRSIIDFFTPKQAFAWQTVLFLSLLAWIFTAISISWNIGILESFLPDDSQHQTIHFTDGISPITRSLFTMGWIFFTISIGWLLAGRKLKVPFLNITIKPAIWVTSALTSAFLFEVWKIETFHRFFISWPIIFAIFSAISKIFIIPESRWNRPNSAVKQEIVITTLICLVLSCWMQFQTVVQNWIFDDFPILQFVNFNSNNLVTQVGSSPPLFVITDQALQDEFGPLPIPSVRRWLVRSEENLPGLNERFHMLLIRSGERAIWELDIQPQVISDPEFILSVLPTLDASNYKPTERSSIGNSNLGQEEIRSNKTPTPRAEFSPAQLENGDRIGLEQTCQVVARRQFDQSEQSLQIEPLESSSPPEQAERSLLNDTLSNNSTNDGFNELENNNSISDNHAETKTLAQEIWETIKSIFDLGEEQNEENEALDTLIPNNSSSSELSSSDLNQLRLSENYLSEVICSPQMSLIIMESSESLDL